MELFHNRTNAGILYDLVTRFLTDEAHGQMSHAGSVQGQCGTDKSQVDDIFLNICIYIYVLISSDIFPSLHYYILSCPFSGGAKVLMGHGIATAGSIVYRGRSWDLAGSMLYCEKNWGSSFPKKWWWLQANQFSDIPDLTLTAVGARRMIGQFYEETIGMIAVHLDGEMYEFSNWSCVDLSWAVEKWGRWQTRASTRTGYIISVDAETKDEGCLVLGPSLGGMIPNVRDASYGTVFVSLSAPDGQIILDRATCRTAQVEIGGGPWDKTWTASVKPLKQPLRGAVNFGSRKVKTS
jgi:Tocopherol cyclase